MTITADDRWNKNRAVVYISGIFAWGIITLVRTVYSQGNPAPLVDVNLNSPPKLQSVTDE